MKKTLLLAVLALFWLSGSALLASGSSVATPSAVHTVDPHLVTETMKCRVTALAEAGKVQIQDPKTEEKSWIQITEDTRITAKKKKAFDGRKKLDPQDIEVGQMLRITHRPHTGEIVRIKVLAKA